MTAISKTRRGMRFALIAYLTTTCFAVTGCKSTPGFQMPRWKMPGSSFFASREPDVETLAGRTGATAELPESPATKYSPNAIASMSRDSGAAAAGTTPGTSTIQAQTVSTPQTGLAASANGYGTGRYQMGGQTQSTQSASETPATSGLAGLPSPYGGTYTGATSSPKTTVPDVALPSSVTGALAGGSTASGQLPPSYSMPSYPPTSAVSPSVTTASAPTSSPATSASLPLATPALSSLPSSSTLPASSAYAGSTTPMSNMPNLPLPPTSTDAHAATSPLVNSGSSTYSPGTTARSTGYNFGAGGQSSPPIPSSTNSLGLPPNTASGSSSLLR